MGRVATWGRAAIVAACALSAVTTPASAGGQGSAAPPPDATASAAPTPAAAQPGKPTTIAAIGDSISQSTGTGRLSEENPKNSWATGWEVNSLAARLGIATGNRFNYSANGARMTHFAGQVTNGKSGGSGSVSPMASTTDLVVVELGGNDLCKDSVSSMTSATDYRNQFRAGIAALKVRAPEALIQVMSIPDIYNLWYIRGATQHPQYHPEPESSQAGGINGARFYWDGATDLGLEFPCRSLLDNPGSWADADVARRNQVRQRNKELNAVLAEECAKVLRCHFDGNQLFDWSSNRITPPDGQLLPVPYRNLVDGDISRNTASGCPLSGLPGVGGSGCGDHFHPSKEGQVKIAQVAHQYGRDHSDTTYPLAGGSVVPSTRPGGLHHGRATVTFTGSDAKGLRGQEVRVHNPDGSVTPWTEHLGVAPPRVVDRVGTSYVEVRSLDVNGNLSAGTLIPVEVVAPLVPSAPGTPSVAGTSTGLKVSWSAPSDDGGGPVTRYDVTTLVGTPPANHGGPTASTATNATPPAPPPGSVVRYQVTATNVTGTGPASAPSGATVAPFGGLAAFVDRQYRDFVGRAPTASESATEVAALSNGTLSPAALVDRLRMSAWYDGAMGPATRLYRAYFLRVPDPTGLDYWVAKRREGRTLDKMSQQFSVSSEFQRRYGELTNEEFIDQIYQNVFGRAPDPSGRAFYLGRLAAGWSRGRVVLQFSESSEHKRLLTALVTTVELTRGMNGRLPSQIDLEYYLADYASGGVDGLFAKLVGATGYRTRVVG